MQLLLVGAMIGFVSAIALSKFLQRLLFEANGANAEIYFGVGIVMFVATLLACWIPAQRASRVDPIITLRSE
jgi:putative ABC transport system permease protein